VERIAPEGVAAKHITAVKLSTESIIVVAVAVAFAVLSLGAIAREQGVRGPGGANAFTQPSARSFTSSSSGSGESEPLGFY